jgi:hypothetical protein
VECGEVKTLPDPYAAPNMIGEIRECLRRAGFSELRQDQETSRSTILKAETKSYRVMVVVSELEAEEGTAGR